MKDTIDIAILGAGGNGRDLVDVITDINTSLRFEKYCLLGFYDDDPSLMGSEFSGFQVLGNLADAAQQSCQFVNGIGSPSNYAKRAEIIASLKLAEDRFETLIHPSAYLSPSVTLGIGVVVFQQCTITTDVELGDFVTLLPQVLVSHDCQIGSFSLLAGGVKVSGGVEIGNHVFVGTGTTIKENVRIGDQCLLGMGSNVLNDIVSKSKVWGNPAK